MIPWGAMVICRRDDRLLSNCHDAPVHVCMGEVIGPPDKWSQKIDRYCTMCEGKVDPTTECHPGPGTEFSAILAARSDPEAT